jgi:FtsH-binding integral membrane protein
MGPMTSYRASIGTMEQVNAFLKSVYAWMFLGLAVTAVVSTAVAGSPAAIGALVHNPPLLWGLLIVELVLVFALAARVDKLGPGVAAGLFLLYSALNGVTCSMVLLAYTGESVAAAFVVAAGMFGAAALLGATTKRSLAGAGQYLVMALVGLVLASLVELFWRNNMLQFLIAVGGVIIFTGLAAWDAQRLKQMALEVPADRMGAYAVVGALSLYLDFINLFLSLLQLLGNRREE